MNFLAHAFLSGTDEQLLVGNFFADFIKGRAALAEFEPGIARGILLHRQIDSFTDTHPLVAQSKNRLRPKYRHYSGVIVDVFYDHFLARNWNNYHKQALEPYTLSVYRVIHRYLDSGPADFRYMFSYMEKSNWLFHYSKVEGISRALSGMAQRTPYLSKMNEAPTELISHYEKFEAEFLAFFPELQAHCTNWLATH
jgi:acyl carrier protein phosphodiesterase